MCRRPASAAWLFVWICAFWAVACGSGRERPEEREVAPPPQVSESEPSPLAVDPSAPRVVVLGDSLTAGLGLSPRQAYPTVLQDRILEAGLKYTIVNAGVSGDTSAGGLTRLDWALSGDVRVLLVALGGNDGLRGLPVAQLTRNLSEIIERAQARNVSVILAGMEAPPNYGFDYVASFHKVYPELARKYHVTLVPFLLEGVGGKADLNQADGIHPTAAGARIVADNVWTVLKPALEADSGRVARGRILGR
jgi:acyl-CoA thioesterase I